MRQVSAIFVTLDMASLTIEDTVRRPITRPCPRQVSRETFRSVTKKFAKEQCVNGASLGIPQKQVTSGVYKNNIRHRYRSATTPN